jgi:hypothetical protein
MLQAYKNIKLLLKASVRSSESIYKQSHAAQVAPAPQSGTPPYHPTFGFAYWTA